MTLKPVAEKLGELLGMPVTFLADCVGADVEHACADPAPGSVIVFDYFTKGARAAGVAGPKSRLVRRACTPRRNSKSCRAIQRLPPRARARAEGASASS
jgi:hypothetical protein